MASPRVCFLDCETSGLDAQACAIVQYTLAVWCDGQVTSAVTRLVMPHAGALIQPQACAVNGYHPDDWKARGARPLDADDLKVFHEYLGGSIVGGSNVPFDKGFIAAACERLGGKPPRWSHRNADTSAMAFPLWAAGMIENTGLAALAEYFGVAHTKPHDSESDVETTIAVFEALCDALVFKPAAWRKGLEDVAAFSAAGAGDIARKALAG